MATAPPTSGLPDQDFAVAQLWQNPEAGYYQGSIFALPTVVNGRIYVPTFNGGVLVYANY